MKIIKIFFFLLFVQNIFAFDLTVTKSNETCPENGSLSFSLIGQVIGVPVFYDIFLLPDVSIPIATITSNSYSGLSAGSYRVVAKQTIGSTIQTDTVDVVILNQVVPLVFSIEAIKVKCGNDGEIKVIISSGVPVSYQLLNGPVSTNLQSSNVFTNLPVGQYNIRVFDNCGQAVVQTFTLIDIIPSFNISEGQPNSNVLPSCGYGNVKHSITNFDLLEQVFYPLTIQITGFPQIGAPIVTTQTIMSGTTNFIFNMPLVNEETIPYNIKIIDVCGNEFIRNNNVVNFKFNIEPDIIFYDCNEFNVRIDLINYLGPSTVNFISAPAGFVPLNFNIIHPGPFTGGSIFYGNSTNFLPFGDYTVQITDSCGNTDIVDFEIINELANVIDLSIANGCSGFGQIGIHLSPNIHLSNVSILSAPSNYPLDVSSYIDSVLGDFLITNIPIGNYIFQLVDVCGNVYPPLSVTIDPSEPENVIFEQKPSCSLGEASMKFYFHNSKITNIQIIEAPNSFVNVLPYDASFNVNSNGDFYMNSLPAGQYKFKIIDNCGNESMKVVDLIGYSISSSNINISKNCISFNIFLNHISNSSGPPLDYWLQKYNVNEAQWEHPDTGLNYVFGSVLDDTNAYELINFQNNLNLVFGSGEYRIVKVFYCFSNGTSVLNPCISTIEEFSYQSGTELEDVFAFPCSNNLYEIVVNAIGLDPLKYKIITKNGLPFIVDNNTNNIFTGLENAIYEIEIEDLCENIIAFPIDISLLPSPSIESTDLCPGQNGKLEAQAFSFVNYQWYKQGNPGAILSATNFLNFNNFNPLTDSGIYVLQMSTTNPTSCINQTLQFEIKASDYVANAGSDDAQSYCKESQTINLNSLLSTPHDAGGVWTDSLGNVLTSTTINPIDLTNPTNVYTYTVTSDLCFVTDTAIITVNIKELPMAPTPNGPSLICRGNNVSLTATTIAGAAYFWTGPDGFTSSLQNPTITNFSSANDGDYFVYVTVNGCDSSTNQLNLTSNPIPDFTIDGETDFCDSQIKTLSINPTNFVLTNATYQWFFNNIAIPTGTNATLDANQFGTYKAEINVGGCVNELEVQTTEKVDAFQINLSQGCFGNEYFINVTNSADFPGATYAWTGPNGYTSTEQNINISGNGVGDYSVLVTNAEGCKELETITVTRVACFIPNGLSPDNDGNNDYLDLNGYNVKKLSVYNRYGRLVYEKDDYIDEWKGQSFDGKLLPATTYFYVIDYATEGENKKMGWIYISY